ncbi:hypothetical protein ACPWT1_06600 [Ramlibacter sp. MMS24-I3-19]|uniref:hypothetical protein n=1 Tax=Ramlibacter sp. MMS24-I3-19 TaxID=3416606 RepID=UPI003D0015CB
MPNRPIQPVPAKGTRSQQGLLGALLRGLSRSRSAAPPPLAPPGQRSGTGSDSLEPYLANQRDSRPAPLE